MSSPAPAPGVPLARRPVPELGPAASVEVAAAPVPTEDARSWSALLLPVLSAFGMVGFALVSRNVLALALGGGFAAISVVGVVAGSRYQRRRRARQWTARSNAYRKHLAACVESLTEAASRQRAHAEAVHPAPGSAASAAAEGEVWERRAGNDAHLVGRLGIGRAPARRAPRRLGSDPSTGQATELTEAADDVVSRYGAVDGTPLGLDLERARATVLLGNQLPLMRALLVSLSRAVGPAALRVHGLASPAEQEWMRLLPHAGRLVSDPESFDGALQDLVRTASTATNGADQPPHQVIVLTGREDDVRQAWLSAMARMQRAPALRLSLIASLPAGSAPPSEADVVISPDAEGGLLLQRLGREPLETAIAAPDAMSHESAMRYAWQLRRLDPAESAEQARVSPKLAALLEQGVRHHLELPIGVDDEGHAVALDLREAAHGGDGPHGLILGATGSGKSELLRTLLTAAARQNDPSDLAFLLIDFKGGAALSELGRLPHSAGLFTNLTSDLHAVERLCAAVRGELRRRQALLRLANVDDIGGLARARRPGSSDTSLPRLLVVVDEYAELIEQSPDVLDVLTSVARLGRSLGIHLLLCSQRLDDGRLRGLEAHLRYRVCLRTFTAAESMSALGSDLASRLPTDPGWAYLSRDGRLTRLRIALTEGAADLQIAAGRDARPARAICPPPLPTALSLDQLPAISEATKTEAIGLCDRPDLGAQPSLGYDLASGGHLAVVGAPRSGRSTLLTTLVVALARAHPVRELAIHVVSPASGPLVATGGLPHVGTVATSSKLASRVIATIAETVAERRVHNDAESQRILLVIDDLAAVLGGDDELTSAVNAIATAGQSVGVSLAVSCGRWAELRGGLREAMGTRYELPCGEPADSMLPALARTFPRRPAGRVMTGEGHWAQLALPRRDGMAAGRHDAEALSELVASIARLGGPPTPPIQVLPALVPAIALGRPGSQDGVVIGVSGPYAQPLEMRLAAGDHLLVLGNSRTGRSGLLRAISHGIAGSSTASTRQWIIDPRRSLLRIAGGQVLRRAGSPDETEALVRELVSRLAERHPDGRDVLIIDDLELVGGRSSPGLLAPLLDVLPYAADIGLSVVCARRLSGYARGAYEPFFAGFLELCDSAVVLSGDPAEGPVIGGVRPRRLPAGRGLFVRHGEPAGEVHVAWLGDDGPDEPAAGPPQNRHTPRYALPGCDARSSAKDSHIKQ
jgi:S-DNA-T family DNA segregation ATPase FtsK/SpoIIIE